MSSHSSRNHAVICAAGSTPAPAGSEPSPQQRLVQAAFEGDVAEVRRLLGRREVDINAAAKGIHGTPASEAAWWCFHDAVELALSPFFPDLDDSDCEEYMAGVYIETTPLVVAAAAGSTAVVELLLQQGVDLARTAEDGGNSQGEHALFAAAVAGHIDVVRLLLDAGVSPKARVSAEGPSDVYEWGHPVLMLASAAGQRDVCQLLIEWGARVNARTHGLRMAGRTALMVATAGRHTAVVRLLLAHGANPNSRYRQEWMGDSLVQTISALHLAARLGSLESVQLLCDAGADVNAYGERGETALMFAGEPPGYFLEPLGGCLNTVEPR